MVKRRTTTRQNQETTPLLDAVSAFLVSREALNVTAQTLTYYRARLVQFGDWATANGTATIGDVSAATVRTYFVHLQQRGLAPYTVHGYARAIKAMLSFCVAEGMITRAPQFPMPRLPKDLLPAFEPADVIKLLNACDHTRDRLIMLVLLDTGLRASEFVGLAGGDIDEVTGAIIVRHGKGNKQRTVYIGAKTRRELMRYWRYHGKPAKGEAVWLSLTTGERLTGDGLRQLLQRLGKAAQVDDVSPHRFRRTFALWSLRAGMDVYSLQRLMGHADLQVLRRYLDMTSEDLAAAHKRYGAVDTTLKGAV